MRLRAKLRDFLLPARASNSPARIVHTRLYSAQTNRSRKLAERKRATVLLSRRVTAGFLRRRNCRHSRGWVCNLAILYRPARTRTFSRGHGGQLRGLIKLAECVRELPRSPFASFARSDVPSAKCYSTARPSARTARIRRKFRAGRGIIARKVPPLLLREVVMSLCTTVMYRTAQLYIVSYFSFRRGKCAVIYCFADGPATFPPHGLLARVSLFYFTKQRAHTRARVCVCLFRGVNIPFDISHSHLTSPRCYLFEWRMRGHLPPPCARPPPLAPHHEFFHSENTRFVSRSYETLQWWLRDFDIPFAFLSACLPRISHCDIASVARDDQTWE